MLNWSQNEAGRLLIITPPYVPVLHPTDSIREVGQAPTSHRLRRFDCARVLIQHHEPDRMTPLSPHDYWLLKGAEDQVAPDWEEEDD